MPVVWVAICFLLAGRNFFARPESLEKPLVHGYSARPNGSRRLRFAGTQDGAWNELWGKADTAADRLKPQCGTF
jgi:hypothetical protein